jgi:hypothetical protein
MDNILLSAITGAVTAIPPTIGLLVVWLQNKARFDALDQRFDDMRDLWRAEIRRVEEVLDARLKHLEEK